MAQDDEYPAGVSDGRLAACQQDVLKMVELAAQVAEGLAANVDPEAEGAPEANTIKEDAAMFLRLADGVQETMAQSRWPRRARVRAVRGEPAAPAAAGRDGRGGAGRARPRAADAPRGGAARPGGERGAPPEAGAEDEEAQLCRAMARLERGKCEETAEAAGAWATARDDRRGAAARGRYRAPPAPWHLRSHAGRAGARAATRAGGADGRRRAGAGACSAAMDGAGDL